MDPTIFYFLHVFSILLLTGLTFFAFASPRPEQKKLMLIMTGILTLVVFLTGFGLLGILKLGVPAWSIVKMVCLLALSAFSGIVYRRPHKSPLLMMLATALIAVAVAMAYFKPF